MDVLALLGPVLPRTVLQPWPWCSCMTYASACKTYASSAAACSCLKRMGSMGADGGLT